LYKIHSNQFNKALLLTEFLKLETNLIKATQTDAALQSIQSQWPKMEEVKKQVDEMEDQTGELKQLKQSGLLLKLYHQKGEDIQQEQREEFIRNIALADASNRKEALHRIFMNLEEIESGVFYRSFLNARPKHQPIGSRKPKGSNMLAHLQESPPVMVMEVLNNIADRLRDFGTIDFERSHLSNTLRGDLENYATEYSKVQSRLDQEMLEFKIKEPDFFAEETVTLDEHGNIMSEIEISDSAFAFKGTTDFGDAEIELEKLA